MPSPAASCDDAVPALGRAHDAADGGDARLLKGPGDDAVGRHHELLDERGGAILLQAGDLDRLLGQHHGAGFDGFQIERAVLEALAEHALGRRVLQLELRGQVGAGGHLGRRGSLALQPGSHRVVGQLRAVAHQRAINLSVGDRARLVHGKFDDQATRSSFSLSEVMPSERSNGSMGKTLTPV